MSQDMRYAALDSNCAEGASSISSASALQNFTSSLMRSSSQLANHAIEYTRSPSPLYSKPHTSFTVRDAPTAKCDVHEGRVRVLYLECQACGKHICRKCVPAVNDGCHLIILSEIDWNVVTASRHAGTQGAKKPTGLKNSKKRSKVTSGSTKVAGRRQKKLEKATKCRALFIRQQLSQGHEENGLFVSENAVNDQGEVTGDNTGFTSLPPINPALLEGQEMHSEEYVDAFTMLGSPNVPEEDGGMVRKDRGKQREQIPDWDNNNVYTSPSSRRVPAIELYVANKTGEALRRNHGLFNLERGHGSQLSPDEWDVADTLMRMRHGIEGDLPG